MTTRNRVVVHTSTGSHEQIGVDSDRVDAELILADGRRIHVYLTGDGHVGLRAFVENPYLTENADAASVRFTLPTAQDAILDGAQVAELNFQSHPFTERSLMTPARMDGCWYYADQATRDRADGLRTMLALTRAAPANQSSG